jgi:hypothetical protein
MSQWHYRLSGREAGPISFDELVELVCAGEICESTAVRREWPSDWQRADAVCGLFRAARLRASAAALQERGAPEPATTRPKQRLPQHARLGGGIGWLVSALSYLRGRTRTVRLSTADVLSGAAYVPHPAPQVSHPLPFTERGNTNGHKTCREEQLSEAEYRRLDSRITEKCELLDGVEELLEIAEAANPLPAPDLNESRISTFQQPPTSLPQPAVSGEWTETIDEAMRAAEARDAALRRRERSPRALSARLLPPFARLIVLVRNGIRCLPRPSAGGNARRRDRVAGWLVALERRLPPTYVLRPGFRWGAAVVSANITAFGLMTWSERQALRFPKAGDEPAKQVFPIFGECAGDEYMILLAHAVVLAAVAAYLGARWLEARADD